MCVSSAYRDNYDGFITKAILYHKGYTIPGDPKGTGEITGYLGEALLVKKVP